MVASGEIAQLMRFIAEKTKNVKSPMSIMQLARQFKEESGSLLAPRGVGARIERHRERIHRMDEFDMNTKVKMMFAVSAPIDKGFLNELKDQADVGVDRKGRITKYQSKDGHLKLEGSHGISTVRKSLFSDRWHTICEKASDVVSESDNEEDVNWQNDYERKRIELVRFLTKRTKNASSPLSINQLAIDYKAEIKRSEPLKSINSRIRRFRQRIHETNQFDTATKVKMLFALSVPIDAEFLKELQIGAIVELDENQRIKKYEANDGSLLLEGDHSVSAKTKAQMKKRTVGNDSSDSENDGEEEDSSESNGSDEEEDGEIVEESKRSKQTPTSSARRSDRLQKSRISLQNKIKKRQLAEKNSDSTHTRNHARLSRGKKRARISSSSSETSEKDNSEMNFETENAGDLLNYEENLNHIPEERKPESLIDTIDADEFDFDPSKYELDMDHLPIDKKPESLMEVNTEESSTITLGNHYENSFSHYDLLNDVDIPEEKKPESLLEVKTELPEEPSTSNFDYHYEENTNYIPIEPKPEMDDFQ